MATPLIELTDLRREYNSGTDHKVLALDGVSLTIEAGEMVAIVGASGSGKSTLMNILGCLDRPTGGSYKIAGRDTAALDPDELAELRREHFGFIFQRYHLMADLTAADNVEVPAIYVGGSRSARRDRAIALLGRLGLSARLDHRPSQLSGGQQQRVSIARALMNGGDIILADEPTGALDSKTGAEMMALLKELNAEGHTIILITHEQHVAEHADRIVEISDGKIVADRQVRRAASSNTKKVLRTGGSQGGPSWSAVSYRIAEAARMAFVAMKAHKMRSFLTMLGIIIGITSVVSILALGEGAQRTLIAEINSIGTNTIDVYPGRYWGDEQQARMQTLVPADAKALGLQGYVDSVTPNVSSNASVRYGSVSAQAQVRGVNEQYFRVRGVEIGMGTAFSEESVASAAQEVVIDTNTHKQLFGLSENPVGKVILFGKVPVRVVGVIKKKDSVFGGGGQNLQILAPYTTVMWRMQGRSRLQSITVRVRDDVPNDAAETAISSLLTLRHGGVKDFMLDNMADVRRTVENVTNILTLLIGSIGLISLVVGGIGVMNIMLVSVSERITEIGVRTAVGARRSDILTQFLIEAVMVCLVGGAIGVALTYTIAGVFGLFVKGFVMVVTPASVIAAFLFSSFVGVVFGFVPARNAARLDPVAALARE